MGLKGMLTIAMADNETAEKRKIFEAVLTEKRMKKITTFQTTWKISFKDGIDYERAVRNTKSAVKEAAEKASIKAFTAALQIGENFPELFR